MHQPVLYVLTHDSIGLGEDGPTHQPVEHLAACRAIPGLNVFRPGDANEVLECYRTLLKNSDHPAALVLSRQNVATLDRTKYASAEGVARGGYVLSPAAGAEKGILIGTGSELGLCLQAQEMLAKEGIYCRVVSLPCFELFDAQDATYRESVLPSSLKLRVAVEAGIRQGWDKYIGLDGHFVGMSSFGASAPAGKLYEHFRITAAEIVRCVRAGS
jgi:transketolase